MAYYRFKKIIDFLAWLVMLILRIKILAANFPIAVGNIRYGEIKMTIKSSIPLLLGCVEFCEKYLFVLFKKKLICLISRVFFITNKTPPSVFKLGFGNLHRFDNSEKYKGKIRKRNISLFVGYLIWLAAFLRF